MKKLLVAFLFVTSLALADEWMPFNTGTGKAKVSSSGTGTSTKPYDFTGVTVIGIAGGGGGGGSPAGNLGEMQYKFGSSAFGGVPSMTYDGGTTTLTLQAGAKFRMVDPVDLTKKIQFSFTNVVGGSLWTVSVPNADSTFIVPSGVVTNQFVTGVLPSGVIQRAQPTDANLALSDITNNNVATTRHGFVPKLPNDATRFLDGTGAFTAPPGGTGIPGGSNTQVQYNSSAAFGGIPSFTYNTGTTLLTLQAGVKFNLVDPVDTTKKVTITLGGITTGSTRNVTVPDADSVWVVPNPATANNFLTGITAAGGATKAQPTFTNIAGTIGTAQQNIPIGKTLYVDSIVGNNSTALPNRLDKPYLTLTGAGGAIAGASAGDEIVMSPGTFNEGSSAMALPQNISFVGAGAGVTTIVTTGGIRLATGDKVADMTVDARTGSNAAFSFAMGGDAPDTAFTDVTVAGVELLGNAAGFYFNKSGIDRVNIYNCTVRTTLDAVLTGITTGVIEMYDCDLQADGTIGGAAITDGLNAQSGTVRFYSGKITSTNPGGDARGIRARNAGTTVESHRMRIATSGAPTTDLHQSTSATIYNDASVRGDGTALVTSGSISQSINVYEGNFGLSDITMADVSTTKHGFAPKLPNDATKFLNGSGSYTVPPGAGSANPVIQNVGDANATIAAGTQVVELTTTLTAPRVLTLPAASGYSLNPAIMIIDPKGVLNGANTIAVARSGSDTVNNGTANVVVLTSTEAGGVCTMFTDGVVAWSTQSRPRGTVGTGGGAISNTPFGSAWNAVTSVGPSQNAVYGWGHTFDTNDNGKVDVLDIGAGIPKTNSSGAVSLATAGTDYLNAVTAPITNTSGNVGLNVGTDLAFTAAQGITVDDAVNNAATTILSLTHTTSGTPANNLGPQISFFGESSLPATRTMGTIKLGWSDVTEATRTAYMDFGLVNNGALGGTKVRLSGSGGMALDNTADPGAGVFCANTGFWQGASPPANNRILKSNGTVFRTSTESYAAPGTSGNVMTSDGTNWTSAAPSGAGVSSITGTSPITVSPTTGAAVASLNVGVDHAFTVPQSITLTDANAALIVTTETLTHNTSGTPANNLGPGLLFRAQSSTTTNQNQARIGAGWSDVTDATRTGYLDFQTVLSTTLAGKMRLYGSGGLSLNNTTDPGAGIFSANTGIWIGAASPATGKILKSDGTAYKQSTETYAAPGASGNVMTSDGTNWTTTAPVVTASNVLTFTNKYLTPQVQSVADAGGTFTPVSITNDVGIMTGLNVATTIAAPTGSAVSAERLLFRIKDNGVARALTWNAIYRANQATPPTTTVVGQTTYVAFIYNSTDTKWDCVATTSDPSVLNVLTGFTIAGAASTGKILQGNGTNFIASTPTWPTTAGTAKYEVTSDGTNYSAYPSDIVGSSTSSVTTAYAADTYLAGSAITVAAGDFKAQGQYHCKFDMVKTGAGTATPIINVRIGTAGTTADTSRMTFTFGAGTGVVDTGTFDVWLTFRTVGSGTSAVVSGICEGKHNLATTGLFNNANVWTIVGTVSSGFDSSTATKIGVSFNGGTSFSGTNTVVNAQLSQP